MNQLQGCSLRSVSICAGFAFAVAGCGGGAGGSGTPPVFSIGGSVSGLDGTVVLQDNGGDNLSVTTSGAFTFPVAIMGGRPYTVTILTQPLGQTCTATATSGTANANVTNVSLACKANIFKVGGTVTGLLQPIVLQDNQGDALTVSANGSFTFATSIQSGGEYSVAVSSQAAGQLCQVTSGAGTISDADISSVSVQCEVTYTVGGSLSGLTGTLVLQNNGASPLTLNSNGSFSFAASYPSNAPYDVTIASAPTGQTCTIANASGEIASASVTNIALICATIYTIGGAISGLGQETGLILVNNGIDATTIAAGANTFTMNTALPSGASYVITAEHHPPGTHCAISSGTGTVGGTNVNGVSVSCGAPVEQSIALTPTSATSPWGSLILASDGNFYGMATSYGPGGYGAVLKVTRSGTVVILHPFSGGSADGASPYGNLIQASDGNLYGMTSAGGTNNQGVVFQLTLAGAFEVLHSFVGGATDGSVPGGSLIQASDGYLYGLTSGGGPNNYGLVFKMDLAGTETVLYMFGGSPADGSNPAETALIEGTDGNFYGVNLGGPDGNGTFFRVTPAGVETVLHSFSFADGANPESDLIQASDGSFWGTAVGGGSAGNGTVFKITPAGALTVMHSFLGGTTDGIYGQGPLIQASDGNFYGMTYLGGAHNDGTVYRITAAGGESLIYSFGGSVATDGAWASGGLVEDTNGDLYGMTSGGGYNSGTVFKLY